MMRRSRQFKIWLVLLLICGLLAPPGSGTDKQEIIRQAKHAYYNLPSQGLLEMQSAVVPNWITTLKEELKTDIPPDHPALKILNGIHFWLSLDQKGAAKLTHQTDNTPADKASIEGMNQTISGVEQVLSGFSQTLAPFLFTSPFPEVESTYELQDQGEQYRLSYKEGQFDVVTIMKKDFAVVEMKVSGPELNASVKPELTSTPKGFLVTGYQATYQSGSGTESYQLSVRIDYKEVEGFQVPAKLGVDATVNGATHKMELQFTDYQIKKK
jgi:hypothetical protein